MAMTPKQQARHDRNMKWRELYEEGKTLQQISDIYGQVHGLSTISRAIEAAGGTIRPTGYIPGEKNKNKPKTGLVAWAFDI